MHEEKKPASCMKVFLVIASYWVVSISMVFANKYLVGTNASTIDVSIFVAWFQCSMTCLFCLIAVQLRRVLLGHSISMPSMNSSIIFNPNVVLLYIFYCGMLICNNYCLKYVGVAFFQVARSLGLIFTVTFSMILLKQKVSLQVFGCCMIVVSGFVLGVDQEKISGSLSVIGVVFGVVSSCFIAMNGIFIKRVLVDITKNNSLYNVFYMNMGGSMLMLPLLLYSNQHADALMFFRTDSFFSILLIVTSALGFIISFMGTLVIEVTSPTTHHVSNNTRSVVQTVIAVIVYREYKTNLWWGSILLVITGAALYTYTRNKEIAAEKALPVKEGDDATSV